MTETKTATISKKPKFKLPSIVDLLQAGAHLGHKKSKWNPQMKPFILKQRNGIHIMDVEKTLVGLADALAFIAQKRQNKQEILFVCTKAPLNMVMAEFAHKVKMPYVTRRWLGGTLTNFKTIGKRIRDYNQYQQKKAAGELEKYTKKEQLTMKKDMERLEKKLDGLVTLEKIPAALFVAGLKEAKTAVREAQTMKIPVIALCDTDAAVREIDWPIVVSDDSLGVLKLILETVKQALD
ncbi:MAG: 30S ribosomal protein S2 [Candidatus Portnoybacteria bacterium CG10_big_fil_rev_8_21_14_0_10_44_7]|uniref:Small ribosomal subunit protein uS2 n=1 Tax=Candidatus Portnoybacteria bacterium CG10_big_fil_rev_8_21_14_0_10_44_7 TaxID=1974816 RepID=A0A2M8KI61_9BACT|nr:MAG: 30S ribosomal protein S2 [Candidatus Portnoybacteria bacterium CG10_big_fil_rev_8_21_14_0_10_44_7]